MKAAEAQLAGSETARHAAEKRTTAAGKERKDALRRAEAAEAMVAEKLQVLTDLETERQAVAKQLAAQKERADAAEARLAAVRAAVGEAPR